MVCEYDMVTIPVIFVPIHAGAEPFCLKILMYCKEKSEASIPANTPDAFKHCYVSCENAKCLKKFYDKIDAIKLTFIGGVMHEFEQLLDGEAHTVAGSLADIKSNLMGLLGAFVGTDCKKNCEDENKCDNPL